MQKLICFFIAFVTLSACVVCADEPATIPGKLLLIETTTPLEEQVAVEGQGYFLKPSGFKFYMSNISYQNGKGEFVQLLDAYLFDAESPLDTILNTLPEGTKAIRFGLGVPAGTNTGDPTIWPNTHPYSIKGSKGMHWTWNTGYRFVVFEGRRDTSTSGTFTDPFSFHTGTDSLYTEVTIPITGNSWAYKIQIDPKTFFHNIDLSNEFETHTSGNPDLARRFTDNVKQSFSIRPANK